MNITSPNHDAIFYFCSISFGNDFVTNPRLFHRKTPIILNGICRTAYSYLMKRPVSIIEQMAVAKIWQSIIEAQSDSTLQFHRAIYQPAIWLSIKNFKWLKILNLQKTITNIICHLKQVSFNNSDCWKFWKMADYQTVILFCQTIFAGCVSELFHLLWRLLLPLR